MRVTLAAVTANKTSPAVKKRSSPVRVLVRVLSFLVTVGVVLGCWRYLGQGVGIGSPGWLTNAFDTVTHFFHWVSGTANRVSEHIPIPKVTIPHPTGTVTLHPTVALHPAGAHPTPGRTH